jgi:predicted dehydrogenase
MRIGVIGNGHRISNVVHKVIAEVEPAVRVVAVIDPDEPGARSRLSDEENEDVVFYDDVDGMMRNANLDGVAIGTRCNLHASYASQVARYDVPLFLEKPVAVNMDQALQLERAFEHSRCPVVVSFPLRVSPLCRLARTYVEGGVIGGAEHVLGVNFVPYGSVYFEKAYRNYDITQGLFLQKATHDFDYLMYLVGKPIVRVAAVMTQGRVFGGSKPSGLWCSECREAATCEESPQRRARNLSGGAVADHPCVFGEDIGSPNTGMNEDSSSALLQFADGTHGAYTQVFFTRRDAATRGATISGYQGTVSFDWYTNELRFVRHHAPFSDTVRADGGMSHFGGDLELAYDFAAVVGGSGRSRTPIETGLQSVYACIAAKQSAETGAFEEVRQVGQS